MNKSDKWDRRCYDKRDTQKYISLGEGYWI